MHPDDASERSLADRSTVKVESAAGRIEMTFEVSDEVARGVVCAPHGWGHDLPGVELATASKSPGVNVNCVTNPESMT